jgi:hypothetical protein
MVLLAERSKPGAAGGIGRTMAECLIAFPSKVAAPGFTYLQALRMDKLNVFPGYEWPLVYIPRPSGRSSLP